MPKIYQNTYNMSIINPYIKAPRKTASENVVCLCRLLNILANFSNIFLLTGKQCGPRSDYSVDPDQTAPKGPHCLPVCKEQSNLEQSDLGPHCLPVCKEQSDRLPVCKEQSDLEQSDLGPHCLPVCKEQSDLGPHCL